MTADNLRLPLDILIAEETSPSDDPEMAHIFEATPWSNGNLSLTRVRYRNECGEVNRVVGSWAPAALLPLNALADCDDERVLGFLLGTNDGRSVAVYSDESVSVINATDEDAVMFEVRDSETFLPIHSCSLYCNALDEPLLCRCTVMPPDHRHLLRRAVALDVGQIDGPSGPDLFGGSP